VAFLILSGSIMIESVRLKLDAIRDPGPGFVPFFLGLSLAILSVIAFIFPDTQQRMTAFWNDWRRGRDIPVIFIGLTVYLLIIRIIGFYIDTFLLMAFLLKIFGERGLKRPLIIALTTVAVTYLLFHKLLFIPFPQGLLGI
jgi:hypothetical protein